jgi:uncharacterized protein with PQ loop repeat
MTIRRKPVTVDVMTDAAQAPTVLEILTTGYSAMAAPAPLLQLRRITARRSAGDVSIAWMTLYAGGCVIWLVYGLSIASVPLVAGQALALLAVSAALVGASRYRRAPRPGLDAGPIPSLSSQITVRDAVEHAGVTRARMFAVSDPDGRALGVLLWDDVVAMSGAERAARLVGEVTRAVVLDERAGGRVR